ncbi:MAG: MBL fold metallo-hydrolase [Anaerolineales bacterium]|nr:MAG: MBL fold metallo-hydrolase [Anaerolineales bacterium]
MQFGDLELHIVSDGQVWSDAGGPFGLVPRALYGKFIQPNADNKIPMMLNCMLVRSEGMTILIDTGLGEKLTPEARALWGLERPDGGLLEALERHGVTAGDVDLVLDTHLHADHCAGNTRSEGEKIVATFPNAEYWVQRMEWAEASHADARTRGTYFPENFVPLWEAGKLRLLHGDTQVTRHLRCVVTPGHTRGHQSILFESGDWLGMYVADMASYTIHMSKLAWLTSYDVLPLENIRTKEIWRQWAIEKDAWLFFEHDPAMTIARFVEKNGRYVLEPIEPLA